ncbi:DUF6894 family protein [Sphingomonas zeicaulis]|uniref:DUF6894 family protein n=1 Tax=Sphingomonas zeicaulis TaxID=1632740 RepID=UPI003D21D304
MPRYHVTLHEEEAYVDTEGQEFPDIDAATRLSVSTLANIAETVLADTLLSYHGRVEVSDQNGRLLKTVHLDCAVTIVDAHFDEDIADRSQLHGTIVASPI